MVELSKRRFVELWNDRVVESSNGGMEELVVLSNRRIFEWRSFRIVEWWNGGVVESSNGGMMELSYRRMAE